MARREPVGPGEPGYLDASNFPKVDDGQTWFEARFAQSDAIDAAARETMPLSDNSPTRAQRRSTSWWDWNSVLPLTQDTFARLVPYRPYCADNPSDGVQILRHDLALTKRHVQVNPPFACRFLCHDLDVADAESAHRRAGLSEPNVMVINPDNGHAHSMILLKAPVARHVAARMAPLRYLAAIEYEMGHSLRADPRFANLIVKNPLHPHWRVEWRRAEPYTLRELADQLPLLTLRFRPDPRTATGLSRNCDCFDLLRSWAYNNVLAAKHDGVSLEAFVERLFVRAVEINLDFSFPLGPGELQAIARSVGRWTWRVFSAEKYRELKSQRGKAGAAKRWAGHVSKETTEPWSKEGISRATYYRRQKQQSPLNCTLPIDFEKGDQDDDAR